MVCLVMRAFFKTVDLGSVQILNGELGTVGLLKKSPALGMIALYQNRLAVQATLSRQGGPSR